MTGRASTARDDAPTTEAAPIVAWPRLVPERLHGGIAGYYERRAAAHGDYPPEWPGVAWLVKTLAGWRCARCGHAHEPTTGFCLTVHHLDGDKRNLWDWNLAALCQRCHLRIQARVAFFQDWYLDHSPWMARHVIAYNAWAAARERPLLTLAGVAPRDYSMEWA